MNNPYGIQIGERMAGSISFSSPPMHPNELNKEFVTKEKYPFDFTIFGFSPFPLQYPLPFNFQGECHLPGFPIGQGLSCSAKTPKANGQFQISANGVFYDLETEIPGYGKIQIKGSKNYKRNLLAWKTFRKGLVYLKADVLKGSQVIGEVEMTYPLPLWRFPLGVKLISKEYGTRPNLKLARKLFRFVPALYPHYFKIAKNEEIISLIEIQLSHTGFFIKWVISISSFLMRFIPWKNSNESRSQIPIPVIATVLTSLFSERSFLESLGQNVPKVPKFFEDEKWMALSHGPSHSLTSELIECDVVVIGSGAGGAALASSLAEKGFAVSIVEEGEFFKRQDLTGISAEMARKLYREKGMSLFISNSPIWVPTGKCVGGTTFINSGTCVKAPLDFTNRVKSEFHDQSFDLEKYYPLIEKQLGFNPVPKNIQGGIAEVLAEGLQGTSCRLEPLTRAEKGCDGQAACVIGCPTEAKRSTAVSFIPEALKNHAHLFSPFYAEKIVFDGLQAKEVVCQVKGFEDSFKITFKAKAIVVAAGTFGSPSLLYRSGLGRNRLRALGENLSIHPALTVGALFDEKVRETFFVPQSMGIFDLGHDDYICEGYTLPVDVIPTAMFQWGSELSLIINHIQNFTNFSSMLKDVTYGKLHFTPFGTIPSYLINDKTNSILKHSAHFISDIFLKAGAKRVYLPINGHRMIQNQEGLRQLNFASPKNSDYSLSAHHPLGTCRMGNNPDTSVTNFDGKVHGYSNLYICDGSVIPGPLGVNPQVTIMANALRIADQISKVLS